MLNRKILNSLMGQSIRKWKMDLNLMNNRLKLQNNNNKNNKEIKRNQVKTKMAMQIKKRDINGKITQILWTLKW
jgi:hypothetical protein